MKSDTRTYATSRTARSALRAAFLLPMFTIALPAQIRPDPALLDVAATTTATPSVTPPAHGATRWIVRLIESGAPPQPFHARHRGLTPQQSLELRHEEKRQRAQRYNEKVAAIGDHLDGIGARIIRHLPQINTLVLELPDARVEALKLHPAIACVARDAVHRAQLRAFAPSDGDLLAPEHHAANIAHKLGYTGANGAALLAVLDYWLVDDYGGTQRAHQTLFEGGDTANPSRVLLQNNSVPSGTPWTPTLAIPNKPWGVDHGTGMAAFAAGAACNQPTTEPLTDGQAPGASIVGVNITQYWDTYYNCGGVLYNDVGYFAQTSDTLAGLNWLLNNPTAAGAAVRVACLSFGGPTNPDHPLALTVDQLARDADILVVTPTGNYDDFSQNPYEAFNQCNGLCVGGTGRAPSATDAHPLWPGTGTGPLTNARTSVPCSIGFAAWNDSQWRMPNVTGAGDAYRREYPDIAAVASQVTAAVHLNESTSTRVEGTSISGAIVAGAATLMMNGRDGGAPTVTTVLEAKAMMLATAVNGNADGAGDNEKGAGFLRTDRLTNDPLTDAATTHNVVSIGNTTGLRPMVASFPVTAGERHAVVLTWFRTNLNPGLVAGQPVWADIDLMLFGSVSGQILTARSLVNPADTFGNRTWERAEFVATANETINVVAFVNRAEAGTPAPTSIDVGFAATRLGPVTPGPNAAVATITSLSAPPCDVAQTTPSSTSSTLPAGVTLDPEPITSRREIALAFAQETAFVTDNAITLEVRGRFARNMSIPCSLQVGTSTSAGSSPGCASPGSGVVWQPDNNGTSWDSTLVIDADAGVARAEFAAISGGNGPRFLVFTATPEMAIFMPRPPGTPAAVPFGPVPSTSVGGNTWAAYRAAWPLSGCPMWNVGSLYYDLSVTRGAYSSPSGIPTLTMTQGMPRLRALGDAMPGRTYSLVIEGAEQGPGLNWNSAVIVSDFSSTEQAFGSLQTSSGTPACWSINKPGSSTSGTYFFGPSLQESAIAIDIPLPLSASVLGTRYFQQAMLVSDVSGTLQIRPSGQVLDITVGW